MSTDRELLKAAHVQVDERTAADAFENAIRRIGIVFACEWFGHEPDSEFTRETIRTLAERSRAAAALART